MALAAILLAGAGWYVIMLPPNNPHRFGPGPMHPLLQPPVNRFAPPTAPESIDSDLRVTDQKRFHESESVVDAMVRLLRPSYVPILVNRVDDDHFTARGTPERVRAVSRFLDLLRDRHHSGRMRLATYTLPPDQAKALEDVLESSNAHIKVRRDRSTLRIRASDALHGALDNLMQYLQPNMQSMVDVSNHADY